MKKTKILVAVLFHLLIFTSCSSDKEEIDTEYPVIDVSASNAFPVQCSEVNRGQKIMFGQNSLTMPL